MVGISEWVSRMAVSSGAVPEDTPIVTIPNAISAKAFYPHDTLSARSETGIPSDLPVVLLGATKLKSYYKGIDLAMEALHALKYQVFVVLFGADSHSLVGQFPRSKSFGLVQSDLLLSQLYSAADVFVAPSIAEAFGKTIVEAMACGTPPVAFNATGPATIIEHKLNGYLAEPFEPASLRDGIEWLLASSERRRQVGISARDRAVNVFDAPVVADLYISLYQQVLTSSLAR